MYGNQIEAQTQMEAHMRAAGVIGSAQVEPKRDAEITIELRRSQCARTERQRRSRRQPSKQLSFLSLL